jgi:hypothetical protein
MSKANEQRSETRPKPTKPTPGDVVPFPSKRDTDFDQLNKWVNLGDQVLGSPVDRRKKA